MRRILTLVLVILSVSVDAQESAPQGGRWQKENAAFWEEIQTLMEDSVDFFDQDKYRTEIVFTRIIRDAQNRPDSFITYYYNPNLDYYYPASAVKLPVAYGLVKHMYNNKLVPPDRVVFDSVEVCKGLVYDTTVKFGDLIKEMLVFSNNEAFNYAYDILGSSRLEALEGEAFMYPGQITRRLYPCRRRKHFYSPPYSVVRQAYDTVYTEQERFLRRKTRNKLENRKVGEKHYSGGKLKNRPKNFTHHNYLALYDVHQLVKWIMFYEFLHGELQFEQDMKPYMNVLKYNMAATPQMVGDTLEDGYTKFLFMGEEKEPLPKHMRIFNIVGRAYGFMTESAYVVDIKNGIEFLCSARIYVNENGVLGDDQYQYSEVGFPFFKRLGWVLYGVEKEREHRLGTPDLGYLELLFNKAP